MSILPLIRRELSVAVRQPMTIRWRIVAGGGAMLLAVWTMMVWGTSPKFSGTLLFYFMCAAAMVLTVFAGAVRALDTISLEKRAGTLPLLFLSDLTVWDVVLGKLTGAGAIPFLTVLAVFPSLAICQLMGGLSVRQLWSCYSSLVVALFLTLSATVFVSSAFRERRAVVLGTMLILLICNPMLLLYGAVLRSGAFYAFLVLEYAVAGSMFLIAAALLLERTWRAEDTKEEETGSRTRSVRAKSGQIDRSPVKWIMLRRWENRKGAGRTALVCGTTFAIIIGWEIAIEADVSTGFWALLLWHFGILFGILSRIGYAFFNEQQDGSFETFATSGLATDEIFHGFVGFLDGRYCPVLLAMSAYDLALSVYLASMIGPQFALFPLAMALFTWSVFGAVRWLGVYRALMMNSPLLSVFATFARVALFPTLVSVLCLWSPGTEYIKICGFWVGATMLLAVFFGSDARRVLGERGRELLLRPPSEKPPRIESEWSFINWEAIEERP